jgi:hypothetical protein
LTNFHPDYLKKYLYILILSCAGTHLFAQTKLDSLFSEFAEPRRIELGLKKYSGWKFEKAYRIWVPYQVIELVKIDSSHYQGQVVNFVTKKDGTKKLIIQKNGMPVEMVKRLITKLANENIEVLRDYSKVPGYNMGIDGTGYIFEIGVNKQRRIYTYWQPDIQNPGIDEVRNVLNIIRFINADFNLQESFAKFRDQLPKGTYY